MPFFKTKTDTLIKGQMLPNFTKILLFKWSCC